MRQNYHQIMLILDYKLCEKKSAEFRLKWKKKETLQHEIIMLRLEQKRQRVSRVFMIFRIFFFSNRFEFH